MKRFRPSKRLYVMGPERDDTHGRPASLSRDSRACGQHEPACTRGGGARGHAASPHRENRDHALLRRGARRARRSEITRDLSPLGLDRSRGDDGLATVRQPIEPAAHPRSPEPAVLSCRLRHRPRRALLRRGSDRSKTSRHTGFGALDRFGNRLEIAPTSR